jgi:hypothetical protein
VKLPFSCVMFFCASALFSTPGVAIGADSDAAMKLGLDLKMGSVLGSENFCCLSYDQAAIKAFVEKYVSADDMNFANSVRALTLATKTQTEKMSISEKTAHCTQIERIAKFYGFMK